MTSYAIKRTRRHACGGKWKLLLPAAALLLLGAALFLLSRPALLHSPEDNRKGGPDAMTVLDVPFLSQLPEFPTGCESVSAVMALQYRKSVMENARAELGKQAVAVQPG